jgi:hypothetical protein
MVVDCNKASEENKLPTSTCACGKRAESKFLGVLLCGVQRD